MLHESNGVVLCGQALVNVKLSRICKAGEQLNESPSEGTNLFICGNYEEVFRRKAEANETLSFDTQSLQSLRMAAEAERVNSLALRPRVQQNGALKKLISFFTEYKIQLFAFLLDRELFSNSSQKS